MTQPTAYFPIVSSSSDVELVDKYYSDATACRLTLPKSGDRLAELPGNIDIWLDPGFDGFPRNARLGKKAEREEGKYANAWYDYMKQMPAFDLLSDEEAIKRNGQHTLDDEEGESLRDTVYGVLDDCVGQGKKPAYITVPQLAQGEKSARNCVNRALARFTGEWAKGEKDTRFIYPLVFTKVSGQTDESNIWKRKVDTAIDYAESAGADFLWVVDSSLDEEKAASTLREWRFPRLIEIHQRLRKQLDDVQIMAGPYWGFNILLWAKGLIDYPVIAVGSGFRYYLSGGRASKPTPRAALPPLRRLALADDQLDEWFSKALEKLSPNDEEFSELEKTHEQLQESDDDTRRAIDELEEKEAQADQYEQVESAGMNADGVYDELDNLARTTPIRKVSDMWREQVASFYKKWLMSIAEAPPSGRKLRLYQQLSRAYVLGSILGGEIVDRQGYDPRPEAHAEQLMQFCM